MKKQVLLSTMLFLACFTGTAWSANPGKSNDVPIGAVLDWWRPDATWSVPDGYVICDGSIVADTKSPLNNMPLPDLTDKFIKGVTSVDKIGESGGSDGHSHTVDIGHTHATAQTSTAGVHTHAINVPPYNATVPTTFDGHHNHKWLEFFVNPGDNKKHFYTYDANDFAQLTTLWSNGIDDAGSGTYPFAKMNTISESFYTRKAGTHKHDVGLSHDHPEFQSASSGPHSHALALPPLGPLYQVAATGTNTPPYYGLLKIMRIR